MAEIKVFCLHCGQHIQCEESCRGTQINCPSCNHSFLVPQAKKALVQPPQAPAPIIAPTTAPASPPFVAPSASPPPQKKRIQIKPDYQAEDKEWDGSEVHPPEAPAPIIAATTDPATQPVVAYSPASAASPPKKVRKKPNYLAEANKWEGGVDPEGWQSRPSRAPDSGTPILWNPHAASRWSFLFSPAFGAFLHAKNADSIDRNEEAKVNMVWFYISLFFIGLVVVSSLVLNFPRYLYYLANGTLLLSWYFHVGVKQEKHVKQTLKNEYQKRSWAAPLSIVSVCWGVAVAALIFFFPASPITQTDLETQVRNDIQETLLKNADTMGTRIDSFNLVHEYGNKYSGILIAKTGSKTESVDVGVSVDGRRFLWKIQPKTQTDLRTPINKSVEMPARTPFNQRFQKHPRANIYGLIQPGESRHLNPTATVLWLAVAFGLLSYARSQKDLAAFIGSLAIIFAVFAASTWIWVSIWSFAVIAIVWLVPRDNT